MVVVIILVLLVSPSRTIFPLLRLFPRVSSPILLLFLWNVVAPGHPPVGHRRPGGPAILIQTFYFLNLWQIAFSFTWLQYPQPELSVPRRDLKVRPRESTNLRERPEGVLAPRRVVRPPGKQSGSRIFFPTFKFESLNSLWPGVQGDPVPGAGRQRREVQRGLPSKVERVAILLLLLFVRSPAANVQAPPVRVVSAVGRPGKWFSPNKFLLFCQTVCPIYHDRTTPSEKASSLVLCAAGQSVLLWLLTIEGAVVGRVSPIEWSSSSSSLSTATSWA